MYKLKWDSIGSPAWPEEEIHRMENTYNRESSNLKQAEKNKEQDYITSFYRGLLAGLNAAAITFGYQYVKENDDVESS
jgi:hypothetical protein